jgi:hypothetical protein
MWIYFVILFAGLVIGYVIGLSQKEADIKKEIALRKDWEKTANAATEVIKAYRR